MKLLYALACAACLAISLACYLGTSVDPGIRRATDQRISHWMLDLDCEHPKPGTAHECRQLIEEERRRKWLGWCGYGMRQ